MPNSKLQSKDDLIDYCFKRLGAGIVKINVTRDQADDRINDALDFWYENHYDGSEVVYLARELTEDDIIEMGERNTLGLIGHETMVSTGVRVVMPDDVLSVVRVLAPNRFGSAANYFTNYQRANIAAHAAYGSYDLASVYFTNLRFAEIDELLTHEQRILYTRHKNTVTLRTNSSQWSAGQWILFECHKKIKAFDFPTDIILMKADVNYVGSLNNVSITTTYFNDMLFHDEIEVRNLYDNKHFKLRAISDPPVEESHRIDRILNRGNFFINDTFEVGGYGSLIIYLEDPFLFDPEEVELDIGLGIKDDEDEEDIWHWHDENIDFIFPDGDLYGYRDVWNDLFIRNYSYLLIKRQWGENLKKYESIPGPSDISFNGQQIYDEAQEAIDTMMEEFHMKYSEPPLALYG